MKRMLGAWVALGLSISASPAAAQQQEIGRRCSADLLSFSRAEARLSWARRCALLNRVGNPGAWFDTGVGSSNSAGSLKDYQEFNPATNFWGQNSYIGQAHVFEVNSMVLNSLYLYGPTSQSLDGYGYYAWQQPASRKKNQPLYPIYGSQSDISSSANVQLFPHPSNANDCNLYLDKAGTISAAGRSFYVNVYCASQVITTCESCHIEMGVTSALSAVKSSDLDRDDFLHDVDLESWPSYGTTMQLVGDELMRGDDIGLYNRMTIYKSIPPELIPGEEGAQ